MSLLDIINITKSSDILAIVKSLSLDEQDLLMKYIYKGLASPDLGASAVLLGWHEKVRRCGEGAEREREREKSR